MSTGTLKVALLEDSPRAGNPRVWLSQFATLPEPNSGDFVKAVAGSSHALFLHADGSVKATGAGHHGQASVPSGLPPIIDIAAGLLHSLALTKEGRVVAWGDNRAGQTSVPEGLIDVVPVAAGSRHSVALRGDGTVVAWGDNRLEQTNLPSDLNDVQKISTGDHHTLALKNDGTVVAWGHNRRGESEVTPNLGPIIDIAAGTNQSFALQANGQIKSWGEGLIPQSFAEEMVAGVVAIAANGDRLANGQAGMYPSYSHLPLTANGRMLSLSVGFDSNIYFIDSQTPSGPLHLSIEHSSREGNTILTLIASLAGTTLSAEDAERLILETRSDMRNETPWLPLAKKRDSATGGFLVQASASEGFLRARLQE